MTKIVALTLVIGVLVAGSAIFGVLAKTAEAGAPEIQIVAAQDEIVHPGRPFEAERLA